jgi:hypothetical protein
LYIGSWIAGAIGMRRQRVTGDSTGSKIAFIVQMIGLTLALLFSVQQLVGINHEVSGWFFAATDIAYPFSHVFMLVVAVFVWRAGVWHGAGRLAPWLVGLALPLFFTLVSLIGIAAGSVGFASLTALGLGTIGYTIYQGKPEVRALTRFD